MTNKEAYEQIKYLQEEYINSCGGYPYNELEEQSINAFDMAVKALGAIDQIRWERDTAIQQLKELGYGLGAKPKYKWHDLRKDPEDLPSGTDDVLIWDDGDAEIGYLSDTVNHGVHKRIWYAWNPYAEEDEKYCRVMNVIAWKEIESFEE